MVARAHGTSLCVFVDARASSEVLSYQQRAPLLTISAGRPPVLVMFSMPDPVAAGHVEFARQLAQSATTYAVEVERRFRGLPRLADTTLADTTLADTTKEVA